MIGGFTPGALQIGAGLSKQSFIVALDLNSIPLVQPTNPVARYLGTGKLFENTIRLLCTHLNNCAQLFVKQRCHPVVIQSIQTQINTHMACKTHLRQRSHKATVRTIVIGKNISLLQQRLHAVKKAYQSLRLINIRGSVAKLREHLSQNRATHAVGTGTQIK